MSAGSLYESFGRMDRITRFSALFETEVCQRLISSRAATGVCHCAYLKKGVGLFDRSRKFSWNTYIVRSLEVCDCLSGNFVVMDAGDEELGANAIRKVYLIKYSQANLKRFPSRESFANCVVKAFLYQESCVKVVHWVCSMEPHEDGGKHYHFALKLSENKRWKPAKKYLLKCHRISVHFSNRHENYYSAYNYATKRNKHALHSAAHLNLANACSPKAKLGTQAIRKRKAEKRESSSSASSRGVRRKRRLSNFDVSEVILKYKVKKETELLALANEQKEEGKIDLAEWVLGKSSKVRNELINSTWGMRDAAKTLERQNVPCIETVQEFLTKDCVSGCSGLWIESAKEVTGYMHTCLLML